MPGAAVTIRPVSETAGAAFARLARTLIATALCAQLAHAVVYGSVFPAGGAHRYLGWYVPAVLVLSGGALALVPVSLATNVLTRGRIAPANFLPQRAPGAGLGAVVRLAVASALFLLVQESLERSAMSGALHVAIFSPLTTLVAAVVLVAAAATVVAVERTLDALAEAADVRLRAPSTPRATWSATDACLVRPRPLSRHGALRAPPLPV